MPPLIHVPEPMGIRALRKAQKRSFSLSLPKNYGSRAAGLVAVHSRAEGENDICSYKSMPGHKNYGHSVRAGARKSVHIHRGSL